jgi:hypothetical protein
MKNAILIGVVSVWLLAACAGSQTLYSEANPRLGGYSFIALSLPNPTAPNVFIVNNKIIVDQEPIIPPGQQGDPVTIFFALAKGGAYTFPNNGIEIHQHPSFCSPDSAYVVRCKYTKPAAGTIYKYVIRVKNETTGQMLRELDPTIWN